MHARGTAISCALLGLLSGCGAGACSQAGEAADEHVGREINRGDPVDAIPTPLRAAARAARARAGLLLVTFGRPDRPASRAMQATYAAPEVTVAMRAFVAVALDARPHAQLFAELVGGRGGLAAVVLDPSDGHPLGVHRGFATPDAWRGFLNDVAARTEDIRASRAALRAAPDDAAAQLALGRALHATGCTRHAASALRAATRSGSPRQRATASELLARAAIARGDPRGARDWLARCRRASDAEPAVTARADLTDALVLLAERRASDAVAVLERTLATHADRHPEATRARLALGRAAHEAGHRERALAVLQPLLTAPGCRERARAEIDHILSEGHHSH